MKKKNTFYTEWAYLVGIICTALGVAFMEKADFGVSMVVAPAYVLYRKLSLVFPFFTFGMSEYLFQAVLLVFLWIILKRVSLSDCFSFITAFIYGLILDLCITLVSIISADTFIMRLILYALGMIVCSVGIAFMFKTYISQEVYELFVKKIALKTGIQTYKVKTAYDIVSCCLGLALSFILFGFGEFIGVKLGTVVCALINGKMIGWISDRLDDRFKFTDGFGLRTFFQK